MVSRSSMDLRSGLKDLKVCKGLKVFNCLKVFNGFTVFKFLKVFNRLKVINGCKVFNRNMVVKMNMTGKDLSHKGLFISHLVGFWPCLTIFCPFTQNFAKQPKKFYKTKIS